MKMANASYCAFDVSTKVKSKFNTSEALSSNDFVSYQLHTSASTENDKADTPFTLMLQEAIP